MLWPWLHSWENAGLIRLRAPMEMQCDASMYGIWQVLFCKRLEWPWSFSHSFLSIIHTDLIFVCLDLKKFLLDRSRVVYQLICRNAFDSQHLVYYLWYTGLHSHVLTHYYCILFSPLHHMLTTNLELGIVIFLYIRTFLCFIISWQNTFLIIDYNFCIFQKCLQFCQDEPVWTAKQRVLATLAKVGVMWPYII